MPGRPLGPGHRQHYRQSASFREGDKRYEEIMVYASEILARAHEGGVSSLPEMLDEEVLKRFFDLDRELD